jgi:hypothetical protein
LRGEYGGPADGDFYREREQKALIEELTGLLVQAVALEVADQQFANSSSRRVGRPPDVVTHYLAPQLLSVFLAGRQSVADSTGWQAQAKGSRATVRVHRNDGPTVEPIFEMHRRPLSASRLARFALDDRRRIMREL